MKLPLSRIAGFLAAGGEFEHDALALGYSIDSRTIQAGQLFFAVKGERLDGHDFVSQALERGAVAAVIATDQLPRFTAKRGLMVVDNTLVALQTLGTAVRRLWSKPLVAITGSTGKTTTKEAIAQILSARFHVLKSEGNFNNHFGLPLMLLKLEPEHDIGVIEMGMSHAGEISALAKIAQPETGVVTNVAPVHLEFFASVAGIARAKYELVQSLPTGGTAILNADDEYVSQFGRDFHGKVIFYGINRPADVRAENIENRGELGCKFDLVVGSVRKSAVLPLIGIHNVYNALAAVAVGQEHGLTTTEIIEALASLVAADKRGQVVQVGNITVINDCYNSNPKALDAMVDALASMPARRRIVVAGEMLELGITAAELHRQAGSHAAKRNIDIVVGVRGLAKDMVEAAASHGLQGQFFATPEEAGEWLARETRDGDVVLLKASRGVKLENALDRWTSERGAAVNQRRGR
ncbi:MAG TPA: UDP-N-acetylmuramoyl-tripeptide--D-alanyl-D-alanine ligase [Terriglobales bacterium]|nr:UDP-N-acetylmuramoyl-tripeptide--D-alanyl-D-alanine ligase [Terriglobales bacterium]